MSYEPHSSDPGDLDPIGSDPPESSVDSSADDDMGEVPEEAPDPIAFEELQRELERGLAEVLGGFEVLDRDLEFDGGPAADVVGLDGMGRLVLVVLLDPGGGQVDEVLGRALDLVALARSRRAVVERHVGRTISTDDQPLAVLVAEEFSPILERRVLALGGVAVRLLQVRELRSARGTSTWFSPVGLTAEAEGSGTPTVEAFAAQLDEELAPLVASLADRLARLDRDLAVKSTGDGLEWRWRGRSLCSLTPIGGRLEGRLEGGDEPSTSRSIADQVGAEAFVDAALARFVALSREVPQEPRPSGLREIELRPPKVDAGLSGPLLSHEELEAFLD